MKKQSPDRLVAIAHHEAGHVVAAIAVGYTVLNVRISEKPLEDGEYGKSRHVNPLYGQDIPDGDPRLFELGTNDLIISLAGPEAEKRIDPDRKVPASDLAKQEKIISCIAAPPDALDQYLRQVKGDTRRLVSERWSDIQKVALALSIALHSVWH